MKKIPMRMCAITKEKLPKQELIRIVRTPDNNVIVDVTGKANGRGVYLKKDIEVLKKAKKGKVLANKLETTIDDTIFEQLESIIK